MENNPPNHAISIDDACHLLGGISRSNIYNLMREGKLRGRKLGNRTIFTPADIHDCLEKLPSWEPKPEKAHRKNCRKGLRG